MEKEKKQEFKELVEILSELDGKNLTLLKSGAELLKAREDLEKEITCA